MAIALNHMKLTFSDGEYRQFQFAGDYAHTTSYHIHPMQRARMIIWGSSGGPSGRKSSMISPRRIALMKEYAVKCQGWWYQFSCLFGHVNVYSAFRWQFMTRCFHNSISYISDQKSCQLPGWDGSDLLKSCQPTCKECMEANSKQSQNSRLLVRYILETCHVLVSLT